MKRGHISRDARICGGQPVVVGTRIPVATLVRSQQLGMGFDQILAEYPSLCAADLRAAMLYYIEHRAEIDALLREASEPLEGVRSSFAERLDEGRPAACPRRRVDRRRARAMLVLVRSPGDSIETSWRGRSGRARGRR